MKAHEIIDRLASLDEAAPVEEPVVEPDVAPTETPERPARRPSHSPYDIPPDFEPGQLPRPKAQDEGAAVAGWLRATQQPIQDWDWNGNELRLLMDDGSTEVYNRNQLEEIGVLGGETAFAESFEDEHGIGIEDQSGGGEPSPSFVDSENFEGPDPASVQAAIDDETTNPQDADGTLDMILGRTPCGGCGGEPATDAAPATTVIQIDGEAAGELATAVSDVVSAILGVVSDKPSEKASDADKSDDKKSDNKKGDKEKPEDKDADKKPAKKDAKKDEKDDDSDE